MALATLAERNASLLDQPVLFPDAAIDAPDRISLLEFAASPSAGPPLAPADADLSVRVGDDLLTYLRQLVDVRACDIRMTPGLVFQAFKPDTVGSTTAVAPDFTKIGHKKRKAPATSALIRWRDTYTEVESAVAHAKRRFLRLEQYPSESSAKAAGEAVIGARSLPQVAVSAEIDPGPGPNANEPYTGFFPGDTIPIVLPNAAGATNETVQSIGFGIDAAGNPRWTVGIKDRILDNEQRIQRVQKRMLGGALAGLSNTPSLLTQQGSSKGAQYHLNLITFTYTGDSLDSPRKQFDRVGDIFSLRVKLDEVWPDDVTVVLRINVLDTPHALECTVPAGQDLARVWLAVGTQKIRPSDWGMLAITTPAAPPRLTATAAFR